MSIAFWRPDPDGPFKRTPTPTVDLTCHHCGKHTRVLTQRIADAEADHWKRRFELLQASLNDMVERCMKEHGDDAVRLWMMRDLIRCREKLGDDGEEWKAGPK
jgi:hypothetical protein